MPVRIDLRGRYFFDTRAGQKIAAQPGRCTGGRVASDAVPAHEFEALALAAPTKVVLPDLELARALHLAHDERPALVSQFRGADSAFDSTVAERHENSTIAADERVPVCLTS